MVSFCERDLLYTDHLDQAAFTSDIRTFDWCFDQPARFGPGEPTERRRYLEMSCGGGSVFPVFEGMDRQRSSSRTGPMIARS